MLVISSPPHRRHVDAAKALRALLVVVPMLAAGCADIPSAPLLRAVNERHGLEIEFQGEWVGPDDDRTRQMLVRRVLLRDRRTQAIAEYRGKQGQEPVDPLGYYREVWSPDGQFLVLPAGRFSGFAIFASATAMTGLQQQRATDSVELLHQGREQSIGYRFSGWAGDHVVRFDGQFEGTNIPFSYDLARRTLSARRPPVPAWSARNADGVLSIAWNP